MSQSSSDKGQFVQVPVHMIYGRKDLNRDDKWVLIAIMGTYWTEGPHKLSYREIHALSGVPVTLLVSYTEKKTQKVHEGIIDKLERLGDIRTFEDKERSATTGCPKGQTQTYIVINYARFWQQNVTYCDTRKSVSNTNTYAPIAKTGVSYTNTSVSNRNASVSYTNESVSVLPSEVPPIDYVDYTDITDRDTGVSAIASATHTPFSSQQIIPQEKLLLMTTRQVGHDGVTSVTFGEIVAKQPAIEEIPIATPAPQPTENESHSHDEMVVQDVAMAIGNTNDMKGHAHGPIDHRSRMDASRDSGLSLRHPQGAVGDTRGTTSTELSPRDETHHEDDQTPERTAQGVTKGQISGLATAPDVSCPLDGHRAVSGTHPPDAAQGLEGHDAHDPVSASPAALWPSAVVVSPVPLGPRTEETAAQVTRSSHKPAVPKPEPTLDELAFKRRCDALQAHINEDWRGYALTERGPIINERMVIKKLVAAYTDTQCAQIWEYLFTRHFKFSKPDYRYTIGAQIMWEQAKNVAQILRGEKENHEPPRSTFVPRKSQIVVPDDWAAAYKAANGGN